jgi:hypothetical protein
LAWNCCFTTLVFLVEDIFMLNVPIPHSCCISRYVFVAIVHDCEFIVLHYCCHIFPQIDCSWSNCCNVC